MVTTLLTVFPYVSCYIPVTDSFCSWKFAPHNPVAVFYPPPPHTSLPLETTTLFSVSGLFVFFFQILHRIEII